MRCGLTVLLLLVCAVIPSAAASVRDTPLQNPVQVESSHRFAAVSVDQWGSSYPTLSQPVLVPRRR